jgi:hypothetical protein
MKKLVNLVIFRPPWKLYTARYIKIVCALLQNSTRMWGNLKSPWNGWNRLSRKWSKEQKAFSQALNATQCLTAPYAVYPKAFWQRRKQLSVGSVSWFEAIKVSNLQSTALAAFPVVTVQICLKLSQKVPSHPPACLMHEVLPYSLNDTFKLIYCHNSECWTFKLDVRIS